MPKAAMMPSLPQLERTTPMRVPSPLERTRRPRRGARGQIMIVAVLALVAIVGMVGLVLDGGALFAQQRVAQNGSDGAATAGTVVIAEYMGGATTRTNQNVYDAVAASALANDLAGWSAEYTNDFGQPIGVNVVPGGGPIPAGAEGVRATGSRTVTTTFSRVFGFDQIPATAEATVVAGPLSASCIADDDGCAVLPITFPVQVSQCDSSGSLLQGNWVGAPPPGSTPGAGYWPLVGAESLPGGAFGPTGDTTAPKYAILPFCKSASGGSGAFGKLDLVPGMNFPDEITGPINATINLPDWFQTQPGNVESVDGELSAWIHKPILIPLNNGACRVNPGAGAVCPAGQEGVDTVGNNTWYYVHTLAVFYIDKVLIAGSEGDQCNDPPGTPLVPTTDTGAGFLGCVKGWFVNYVTAGPIIPGGNTIPGTSAIGLQLIK
ncbi:MAG TPA: Tad domain-containing protein [Aeromicrobium sp.]|nr:Tad domain-containing protein [Aeromicrobium sp.]